MKETLVGFIAGFLASIGVGGGAVLVLYLCLFAQVEQLQAQGMNLLFFIPCALTALLFHIKNKLVDYKTVLPLIGYGVLGVVIGYLLTQKFESFYMRKLFGVFLLFVASSQMLGVFNKQPKNNVEAHH